MHSPTSKWTAISNSSPNTVIDGDWSAALAVAGMLCADGSIAIHGLQNQYTQADEAIRGALLFAGGALSGIDDGIQVAKRPVRPFTVDLTDSPDLFPVLAALAAFGKKPSTSKAYTGWNTKNRIALVALRKPGLNSEFRLNWTKTMTACAFIPGRPSDAPRRFVLIPAGTTAW